MTNLNEILTSLAKLDAKINRNKKGNYTKTEKSLITAQSDTIFTPEIKQQVQNNLMANIYNIFNN